MKQLCGLAAFSVIALAASALPLAAATRAEPEDEVFFKPQAADQRAEASDSRTACQPVEVEVDEGYGVSSRETRYRCRR